MSAHDQRNAHQYLLEALNRDGEQRAGLYALQSGDDEAASALWKHKGVRAISYDPADGHAQLWRSLEAWAARARDPEAWRAKVLASAKAGPRHLKPFERGQVKHLVSTTAGARAFAEALPSAEWLCAFDRTVRYGSPLTSNNQITFDPFVTYGFDDDLEPGPVDPKRPYQDRKPPAEAWDGLAPNAPDLAGLSPSQVGLLRGPYALGSPQMPPRLWWLAIWLGQVCDQPSAVWWAAGQSALHPDLQSLIRRRLQHLTGPVEAVEAAWRWALRSWDDPPKSDRHGFELAAEVSRSGWTPGTLRAWGALVRPHVTVQRPLRSGGPPAPRSDLERDELVRLDVEYPKPLEQVPFPDGVLSQVASELRRALEVGVDLEVETCGFEGLPLPPIEIDQTVGGDRYSRTHGVGTLFFNYLAQLERLARIDLAAVRSEMASWRPNGAIFLRLRIWAAGRADVLSPAEAARTALALDRRVFWDGAHQRDLLLTLERRWSGIPRGLRRRLERRLLAGPLLGREPTDEDRERRAHRMLSRLIWLRHHGCTFSFDISPALAALRAQAPRWRDDYAAGAAASPEGRADWVRKDMSTRGLEDEPPATLLRRAAELSGHDFSAFVELAPLAGLAETRPAKVLRALGFATRRGEDHDDAWEAFLLAEVRSTDRPRLLCAIARRTADLPEPLFARLIYPVTEWMFRLAVRLQSELPTAFAVLWSRALEAIRANPEMVDSAILGSKGYDWITHALNAPAGKLAQAHLADPAANTEGPSGIWLKRAEELMALGGAARRDALVIFAQQLPWLDHHAQGWTQEHLLDVLGADPEDELAFWSGLLSVGRFPGVELFRRLKPYLLAMATGLSRRAGSLNVITGLLLTGWAAPAEVVDQLLVTDEELRDALRAGDDSFRHQVLWQLQAWSRGSETEWRANSLRLLREVWPRELVVRSQNIADDLFSLAVQTDGDFPAFVDAVIPLLTTLPNNARCMAALTLPDGKLDALDPTALLALIFTALSSDPSNWPWGADVVVDRLVRAPETAQDPRTLQLRRRRAAR